MSTYGTGIYGSGSYGNAVPIDALLVIRTFARVRLNARTLARVRLDARDFRLTGAD